MHNIKTFPGLSIVYNDGSDEYLDFVQTTGIRVIIHSQNEIIFPDSQGFYVPSGYKSTAAMAKVILI
jgi:hypothetical protein